MIKIKLAVVDEPGRGPRKVFAIMIQVCKSSSTVRAGGFFFFCFLKFAPDRGPMTTTPASLLLLVFAIGAAPEAASLSVPRDESAAQPASAPAAFVASRLLGSTAPAELLWTKSGCIPSFTHRRRRPTAMGSQMGILDGLKEALRGGGPFRRETNAAKYRNRPRLGIDISNRMATALSALSVALVAGALPLWYGSAQGLWQSFWLTRIVVLRSLSFVFFVAFAVALFQNTALLGDRGLLPASVFLDRVREQNPSFPKEGLTWPMFNKYPTWLWLAPRGRMDDCLAVTSGFGMALSAFVLVNGGSNVMIQLTLWLLYHSLVTVGQRWYAFGWESQLLETGFISILMVPLLSVQALPVGVPTSWVSLWALRWLCFRIMIGAGMIKIRGDSCWRDLTAMCYHYETQPVPNPFSYFLHWTPVWWHKFETAANHVIELLLPWLLVCPVRSLVVLGGIAQLLFQTTLVLSGNLSFLNWLTMIPALGALDDAVVSLFFSAETVAHVQALNGAEGVWTVGDRVREGVYAGVCALLVWLSAPVMRNILSPNQVMNTSFGSWRFVNSECARTCTYANTLCVLGL